ncbi:hypothetical protein QEN19_000307 [Hanseniaspora menglaensis]
MISTALVLTALVTISKQDYAPVFGDCTNDNLIREAVGLSTQEQEWLVKRDAVTNPLLNEWLQNHNIDSETLETIFDSDRKPKIAAAAAGGGYRAMLSGAGMLAGLDSRTVDATESGLGGLLQASTYVSGLSGGNWMTGSLFFNDFVSVQDIMDEADNMSSIWDIDHMLFDPYGLLHPIKDASRWDDIKDDVESKENAGFKTSITDLWGRALAYEWFPSMERGGVNLTWSSLQDNTQFINGEIPMPISVTVGRYPGTIIMSLNSTVFEVNPFELGSWDPSLRSFTNVKYLGTDVNNGVPTDTSKCVTGYDNAGFIMGTSSSLFNLDIQTVDDLGAPSFVKDAINYFLEKWDGTETDIALYKPNPFYGSQFYDSDFSGSLSGNDTLFLGDGTEDGENIPLVPLLQEDREIDFLFALDSSSDTSDDWPNGASLVNTYLRQFEKVGETISFPPVPSTEEIIAQGLNKKPVFFGCYETSVSDLAFTPPIVAYIANADYSYQSNTSTFKLKYSQEERINMIENGIQAITRNGLKDDSNYANCVACAIVKRSQDRLNLTPSTECQTCFDEYCWN